jgi:predicted nucleic acid-binding protein
MGGSDRTAPVGLDTSVVLRLLVGSPPDQAKAAIGFVKQSRTAGVRVVVSDLVVSEAYFALHAHYDVPKAAAIGALLEMLDSGLVEPADGPGILRVLTSAARSAAKPGFVDRLIHEQYQRSSAGMVTFERAASRLTATIVLKAARRGRR